MKSRVLVPELMDDPGLDAKEHRRALAGLRRVNTLCQTGKHVAKEILAIAKKNNRHSIRVLDVGCGSGDIACDVARRLAGHLECHIVGRDISATAVVNAQETWSKCKRSRLDSTEVQFEQADVFKPSETQFDVVYCCLFLHHFTEPQAVEVLQAMRRVATLSVLVDDLTRSRWGYALAQIGCQLLSRSPVVHFDGPQSVRAAFTVEEVRRLAAQAGMEGCVIGRHWPERYLLRSDI